MQLLALLAALSLGAIEAPGAGAPRVIGRDADSKTVRVFIFAGQSNMVGSDSKAEDIQRYPPFIGLDRPQEKVLFSYNIGREEKLTSGGWVALQPVDDVVGPELSFARRVSQEIKAPIAIIKCAAGGTTLGGDWNPDDPSGFKLYPLALQLVRSSLAELDREKVPYRIEGFMWHQGENDMFSKEFKPSYGRNLANFLAAWRRDLHTPHLKFYIGELCTKTIWGMDNRDNMYAIRAGQKEVTTTDPLTEYVPTSHIAVEIGGGEGLHYHYGTLGQLEHGANYAEAYLRTIGKLPVRKRPLKVWPYPKGSTIKLFVLAGHRNMEGERSFTQELQALQGREDLANDDRKIAFKYSLGGGFKVSQGWEPLGPSGLYGTFGPELSFGRILETQGQDRIAIAKFAHSGSQVNDWTPEGTAAKDRNLYPQFIAFIRDSIQELRAKGHRVELAGIFYHVGENDMAFGPYRRKAAQWLRSTVEKSRQDLGLPNLEWYVSQQAPADEKGLNAMDVTADLAAVAAADTAFVHIRALDLPPSDEKLVLNAAGIIDLGERLARGWLARHRGTQAQSSRPFQQNQHGEPAPGSGATPLAYAAAPVDNPLKGFVPYLRAAPTFPHSMEWDYTRLSEVMTGPNQFEWEPFDAKLRAAASRGHQFFARFYLEWPGKKTGVPQYLIDAGLVMRTWTNTNTQPSPPAINQTPDYEDPRLRAALTNFIHALGRRYDGDPRLGFVGLGLLGTWGEWHTYPKQQWFASKTVQREVMDAYEAGFKQTKLVARYPAGAADPTYADNSRRPVGYHDDSFAWATVHTGGRNESWFFESLLRSAGATNKWRTQPIGGEVRPEVWSCLFNDPSCAPKGQEFDACVAVTHVSWLCNEGVFRGPIQGEARERALRGVQGMGYELYVVKAEHVVARDGLDVSLTLTNTGVAPFYYDWPVELGLQEPGSSPAITKAPWKLTSIIPGDPATVWRTRISIRGLPPRPHRLLLRVPNPMPQGLPLRFANRDQDRDLPGWLTLGEFTP